MSNLIPLREICIHLCHELEILPDLHKLTRLETLPIEHCKNLKEWIAVNSLKSTKTLWVVRLKIRNFLELESLTIWRVQITELLDLSLFPQLRRLDLCEYKNLETLIRSGSNSTLEILILVGCRSLKEVPRFN